MKDSNIIPLNFAKEIGKILIEIGGANPKILNDDSDFLLYLTEEKSRWDKEYRFMGYLGFGGKFYTVYDGWKVNCYSESETPYRLELIEKTNKKLKILYDQFIASPPKNKNSENLYLVGADTPPENGFR